MLGEGEGRVFYNLGGFVPERWLYPKIATLEGRFLTEECSTFILIEFK